MKPTKAVISGISKGAKMGMQAVLSLYLVTKECLSRILPSLSSSRIQPDDKLEAEKAAEQ